jgi:hypothetical protein
VGKTVRKADIVPGDYVRPTYGTAAFFTEYGDGFHVGGVEVFETTNDRNLNDVMRSDGPALVIWCDSIRCVDPERDKDYVTFGNFKIYLLIAGRLGWSWARSWNKL